MDNLSILTVTGFDWNEKQINQYKTDDVLGALILFSSYKKI